MIELTSYPFIYRLNQSVMFTNIVGVNPNMIGQYVKMYACKINLNGKSKYMIFNKENAYIAVKSIFQNKGKTSIPAGYEIVTADIIEYNKKHIVKMKYSKELMNEISINEFSGILIQRPPIPIYTKH